MLAGNQRRSDRGDPLADDAGDIALSCPLFDALGVQAERASKSGTYTRNYAAPLASGLLVALGNAVKHLAARS